MKKTVGCLVRLAKLSPAIADQTSGLFHACIFQQAQTPRIMWGVVIILNGSQQIRRNPEIGAKK